MKLPTNWLDREQVIITFLLLIGKTALGDKWIKLKWPHKAKKKQNTKHKTKNKKQKTKNNTQNITNANKTLTGSDEKWVLTSIQQPCSISVFMILFLFVPLSSNASVSWSQL